MRNHFRSKHKISFNDMTETVAKKCKVQTDIVQYSKKESLAEIISRLAALDGFSFHGIVKVNS